jgi:geranylgeranylglycerol-phosphate geranylgeranyltransferase
MNSRKIKAMIQLIRPELPIAAGLCVMIGSIIATENIPTFIQLISGFMWGFLLSSSAMIINDYFDIEVDKVNSPHRPLAAGIIQPVTAIKLAFLTTVIGLVISIIIHKSLTLIYIIFWLIGLLYNWKLKEKGLIGNLLVSSSVAVTFVAGAIVVGVIGNPKVWFFSIMVFLFDLGEEIAADAMDIEGDKKRNVKSLAEQIGKSKALFISFVIFILVVIISILPVFYNIFGKSYLFIIGLMDVLILYYAFKLLKSRTSASGRKQIRSIYLVGSIALLGIFISILIEKLIQ